MYQIKHTTFFVFKIAEKLERVLISSFDRKEATHNPLSFKYFFSCHKLQPNTIKIEVRRLNHLKLMQYVD